MSTYCIYALAEQGAYAHPTLVWIGFCKGDTPPLQFATNPRDFAPIQPCEFTQDKATAQKVVKRISSLFSSRRIPHHSSWFHLPREVERVRLGELMSHLLATDDDMLYCHYRQVIPMWLTELEKK